MKNLFLLIVILLMNFVSVYSQEVGMIGRSPRALLMGDAYTAIADDEYTLFYNPAVLGRNKTVSITPINPSVGITNAIDDLDRFKNFPKSDPSAIAERILNFPVTLEASVFPGLKMANFGFNLFASSKTNIVLRNAIHPVLDVNYKYDRGFITGFAYNLGSGATFSRVKKSSKTTATAGKRFALGIALKHVNREGLNQQFDLFGTNLLSKINSGSTSLTDLKTALGYSIGSAWGVDLGTEFVYSSGRSVFTTGLSILDVGDTQFKKSEGNEEVPIQEMTINSGIAFKQDFGIFDYTLSADFRPITSSIDLSRKFRLGAELSLPLITAHAGFSEGYISYGATVKLWPVKFTAGFYGVEVGTKYREQEAKRFIVYLSLFDFSFGI